MVRQLIFLKNISQDSTRKEDANLANLAAAYFHNGEKEKANEIFDELEKKIDEGKTNQAS